MHLCAAAIFPAVLPQVFEDAGEFSAVNAYPRRCIRFLHRDMYAVLGKGGGVCADVFREEVTRADGFPCERQFTRVEAQKFTQPRGQSLHGRGGLADAFGVGVLLLGRRCNAVENAARIPLDRGERGCDVVEDADEECAAAGFLLRLTCAGAGEILSHLIEGTAGCADLIMPHWRQRVTQVAALNGGGGAAQLCERRKNLCGEETCEIAAEQQDSCRGHEDEQDERGVQDEVPHFVRNRQRRIPAHHRNIADAHDDGTAAQPLIAKDETVHVPAEGRAAYAAFACDHACNSVGLAVRRQIGGVLLL